MRTFKSAVMYTARYQLQGENKVYIEKRIFVGSSMFLEDTLKDAIALRSDDFIDPDEIVLLSYKVD